MENRSPALPTWSRVGPIAWYNDYFDGFAYWNYGNSLFVLILDLLYPFILIYSDM